MRHPGKYVMFPDERAARALPPKRREVNIDRHHLINVRGEQVNRQHEIVRRYFVSKIDRARGTHHAFDQEHLVMFFDLMEFMEVDDY